jgi:hypothetical protein
MKFWVAFRVTVGVKSVLGPKLPRATARRRSKRRARRGSSDRANSGVGYCGRSSMSPTTCPLESGDIFIIRARYLVVWPLRVMRDSLLGREDSCFLHHRLSGYAHAVGKGRVGWVCGTPDRTQLGAPEWVWERYGESVPLLLSKALISICWWWLAPSVRR